MLNRSIWKSERTFCILGLSYKWFCLRSNIAQYFITISNTTKSVKYSTVRRTISYFRLSQLFWSFLKLSFSQGLMSPSITSSLVYRSNQSCQSFIISLSLFPGIWHELIWIFRRLWLPVQIPPSASQKAVHMHTPLHSSDFRWSNAPDQGKLKLRWPYYPFSVKTMKLSNAEPTDRPQLTKWYLIFH